jgi:S1-C subfamily serine protease
MRLLILLAITAAWSSAAQPQKSSAVNVCGWIGVGVDPMTVAFADSLGMTEQYGAIFKRPRPGGPAAKAGIEAYDVVTSINGAPLMDWRDFAPTISQMAPDTTVYLTTWRSRQMINVRVVLGAGRCQNPTSPRRRPRQ